MSFAASGMIFQYNREVLVSVLIVKIADSEEGYCEDFNFLD
jgi:hypothetical protein